MNIGYSVRGRNNFVWFFGKCQYASVPFLYFISRACNMTLLSFISIFGTEGTYIFSWHIHLRFLYFSEFSPYIKRQTISNKDGKKRFNIFQIKSESKELRTKIFKSQSKPHDLIWFEFLTLNIVTHDCVLRFEKRKSREILCTVFLTRNKNQGIRKV